MADIVDTAVNAGSFNTLAAALKAADLVDTFKGTGPFTVMTEPLQWSTATVSAHVAPAQFRWKELFQNLTEAIAPGDLCLPILPRRIADWLAKLKF